MAAHIPPIAPSPPPSPRRSTSRRLSSPAVLSGAAPPRSPHRPRTSEGSPRPKFAESLGVPSEGERHSHDAEPRLSQTLPRRSSSGTSGNYPNLLLSQTLPRPSTSSGCRSNASSPFSSPRPPSSPSGRNGMQTSPLSRRYDLKPPVPPANAPYQATSPAPLQNAALRERIMQMRLPEAPSVVDAILNVEGTGESELPVLCETFHQRVADIFNNLQLAGLGPAVTLITRMSEASETVPLLKPEDKLKGLLESRLNCFLHQSARILDARVENSVHSNRNAQGGMLGEFDHLLLCHEHAEMLAHDGLASLKSVKKTMEHLLRLVESAPLVDLQHRVCELIKTGERSLEEALLDRLRHVSMKNRTFGDMRAVSDAVVLMHQKMELPLFLPEVEDALCSELPSLVKVWNLERLQMEIETEAGLQTLTRSSSRVWESVNNELSSRLFQWMQDTISTLRQTRGLDKAQAEITRWKKMALRAIGVGMLVFAPEMKDKIICLFSRCYDDCLGNPNLSQHADEIDRMLFQVSVIMGADRRANPAELRKAGTFNAKSALPRLSAFAGH